MMLNKLIVNLYVMLYYRGTDGYDLPKDIMNEITRFQRKQKKGTIDVWWLYDDGGKVSIFTACSIL